MNFEFLMKINSFMALLFLITVHEAAHAWMAERCGDSTGRMMGRITLNPIPHLDLVGTVIIPLFMIFLNPSFVIIGWGKPCPVNPNNYKNYKRDDMLVAIAGPAANFIVSIIALFAMKFVHSKGGASFLYSLSFMGFILGGFNLFPLPPLDGSHILRHFLPSRFMHFFHALERYSIIVLLILINTPFFGYFLKPIIICFRLATLLILG